MDRPSYWKHLAEEHGDCLCDFLRAGVQPGLCYEQAVISAHFAHLYMSAALPDLEAPEPGTVCPDCGEYTEVTGFCGVCEERNNPRTLEGFLRYAAESTVNSR